MRLSDIISLYILAKFVVLAVLLLHPAKTAVLLPRYDSNQCSLLIELPAISGWYKSPQPVVGIEDAGVDPLNGHVAANIPFQPHGSFKREVHVSLGLSSGLMSVNSYVLDGTEQWMGETIIDIRFKDEYGNPNGHYWVHFDGQNTSNRYCSLYPGPGSNHFTVSVYAK